MILIDFYERQMLSDLPENGENVPESEQTSEIEVERE